MDLTKQINEILMEYADEVEADVLKVEEDVAKETGRTAKV